jgi:hypothetical protein
MDSEPAIRPAHSTATRVAPHSTALPYARDSRTDQLFQRRGYVFAEDPSAPLTNYYEIVRGRRRILNVYAPRNLEKGASTSAAVATSPRAS